VTRDRQVIALADRLAVLLTYVQDMTIDCWLDGDDEGAKAWEHIENLLVGPNTEDLVFARDQWRQSDLFNDSVRRVRDMLRRELTLAKKEAA